MKDTNALNDKAMDKKLAPSERLETLFYLYNRLNKEMIANEEKTVKNIAAHEFLLKEFKKEIDRFESLESGIKERIDYSIGSSAVSSLATIEKRILEASTEKVRRVVNTLQESTQKAKEVIDSYQAASIWDFWKMAILAALVGAFVGVMSTIILVRDVNVSLPYDALPTYNAGQFMQSLWPKLNKKEQERLKGIEGGKIKKIKVAENLREERHTRREDDSG